MYSSIVFIPVRSIHFLVEEILFLWEKYLETICI
jgi:hypothetical protein